MKLFDPEKAAQNAERKAELSRAKAGKTFRRSGKHVRAAQRNERMAEKIRAKAAKKAGA